MNASSVYGYLSKSDKLHRRLNCKLTHSQALQLDNEYKEHFKHPLSKRTILIRYKYQMRYTEIISETISLTRLHKPLSKAIYQSIITSANEVGSKENQIDKKVKEDCIKNVSLREVADQTKAWLDNIFIKNIENSVTELLRTELKVEHLTVDFKETKVAGYASGIDITLNINQLKVISKEISEGVYTTAINRIGNESEIFDMFFKVYRDFTERDFWHMSLDSTVSQMVSTLIHESVHVVQHNEQFKKGRTTTEYRSYLEKDKSKFYKAVDYITSSPEIVTDNQFDMYKASPQEIAAFANQTALEFIKQSELDNTEDLDSIKSMIVSDLRTYIDTKFNQPNDPIRYQVFKRFSKQIYQEVISYLERTEKERKDAEPPITRASKLERLRSKYKKPTN